MRRAGAARAIGALAFASAQCPAVLSQPLSRARRTVITSGADIAEVPFPVTRDRLNGLQQAAEHVGIAWRSVIVAVCGS